MPAPIDPRELVHDPIPIRRFGQLFRPSPDYRRPERHEDPLRLSTFSFVLKQGARRSC